MSSVSIQIAQAVTDDINAYTFAIGAFTARRSYADWDEKFSDLNDMQVDVVYVSHQTSRDDAMMELDSATTMLYRPAVDIAVRKRFEDDARDTVTGRMNVSAVDPYVSLLEEIHELFVSRRNTDVLRSTTLDATWDESMVLSWVNQKKLRAGLFEGVVRITFNVSRAI